MDRENNIEAFTATPLRKYLTVICTIGIGVVASLILFIIVNNWEQENQRISAKGLLAQPGPEACQ